MKKTIMFAAAALSLGLASVSAPASATTTAPAGIAANSNTDVSAQRYMERRTVIRRGRPFCETRIERRRGPMGRVVVTKTRICR